MDNSDWTAVEDTPLKPATNDWSHVEDVPLASMSKPAANDFQPVEDVPLTSPAKDASFIGALAGDVPIKNAESMGGYDSSLGHATSSSPTAEDNGVGRTQTAAGEFVKGVSGVVASVPKSIALLANQHSNIKLATDALDKIDAGNEPAPRYVGDVSQDNPNPYIRDIVNNYRSGDEATRKKIREQLGSWSQERPENTELYQAGKKFDAYMGSLIKENPRYQQEFWAGKVPQGLGSTFGFLLSGAALGPGGVALSGSASGSVQGYEDALDKGASLEQALNASGLNAVVGTSEALPISHLLDRVDKGTGGVIKRALVNAMKSGTEEAIQEAGQQIAQNLVASKVVKYDPNRGTFDGAGDNAGVGFTSGGLLSFLTTLVAGRRARGAHPGSDQAQQAAPEVQPTPGATVPTAPTETASPVVSRETAWEPIADIPLGKEAFQAEPTSPTEITPQNDIQTTDQATISPDPVRDLNAQVSQMFDPQAGRDAVLVPTNTDDATRTAVVAEATKNGAVSINTPAGVVLTTSVQKANEIKSQPYSQEKMGEILFGQPVTPKEQTDGTVVQARTPEGAISSSVVTNQQNMPQDAAAVARTAAPADTLETTTVDKGLAERQAQVASEATPVLSSDTRLKLKAKGFSEDAIAKMTAPQLVDALGKRKDLENLMVAFKDKAGNVIVGDKGMTHANLIGKEGTLNKSGYPRSDLVDGFVDKAGKFYTRNVAMNKFGILNSEAISRETSSQGAQNDALQIPRHNAAPVAQAETAVATPGTAPVGTSQAGTAVPPAASGKIQANQAEKITGQAVAQPTTQEAAPHIAEMTKAAAAMSEAAKEMSAAAKEMTAARAQQAQASATNEKAVTAKPAPTSAAVVKSEPTVKEPGGQYAAKPKPAFDQKAEQAYSDASETKSQPQPSEPTGTAQGSGQDVLTTVAGGSPAQGWSSATRIRGKSGPLAVIRGQRFPLVKEHFAVTSLGKNTNHPTSGFGVFFSNDANVAAKHGKVEKFYLDIRNPKVIKVENLPSFETAKDAYAFREKLRAQGYDGIVISARHLGDGRVDIAAFDPEQVIPYVEDAKIAAAEPESTYDVSAAYEKTNATAEQKALGQSAVDDLGRKIARGGRLLGSRLPKEFVAKGGISLVGQKVNNPTELAQLAQVYRDPRFETFRIFFTKGNEIVGQTGISSRLPGQTKVFTNGPDEGTSAISEHMAALKADGYYLLHNHPSGLPNASSEDMRLTDFIREQVPGFKEHVIINEKQFGVIQPGVDSLMSSTVMRDMPSPYKLGESAQAQHYILGEKIESPSDLARLAKHVQKSDGYFVLIGSNRTGVTGIMELPLALLKNELKAGAAVKRFAQSNGSSSVYATGIENNANNEKLVEKSVQYGFLRDVIYTDGTSAAETHASQLDSGDFTLGRPGNEHRAFSAAEEKDTYNTKKFSSPETESRYQEARKGLSEPTKLVQNVKDWLTHIGQGFTRHHIDLPNTPEFSKAKEALRQFEAASGAAKERTVAILKQITKGMSPQQYDQFTRKVILDDLVHENSRGHELPFGFTSDTLLKDYASVTAEVNKDATIKDALQKRKDFGKKVTERLVQLGILSKEQLKNPDYYRHQVLTYARAQNFAQGSGSKLKKPTPGYARKRHGSLEDINANYLEAEFEYLHKALIDIRAQETINEIKKQYDIKERLNQEAKAANANLKEGEKKKTWRDFIPDGYVAWQPDKGNMLFTGHTIGEQAMTRVLDALGTENDVAHGMDAGQLQSVANEIKEAMLVGQRKPEIVVPEGLAKTLDKLRPNVDTGMFDHVFAVPLGWWKRWILINPLRVLKYNLNNMSGDMDAVIAGNPKAIRKMKAAIKELWNVKRGGQPSSTYWDALERGVFDSGLSIQEIPEINKLDEFKDFMKESKATDLPFNAVRGAWRTLKDYTQFRENWMRYAAYLDYKARLDAGESMKSIGYGASDPKMVDQITDTKDKAALLARELVGDYGNVSAFGQGIRKKVIPFFSWMEVNSKRYLRFIDNAFKQGIGQGIAKSGVVGGIVGSRLTAYLFVRMAFMYALVGLWNNLRYPDDEEQLSDTDRVRLHLLLGRDQDNKIRQMRFQGSLSDFLQWVGFEDAVGAAMGIEKGKASWEDVAKAVAKAPVNKVASGITPLIKTPVELASGKSFYPDVFNPRRIYDKGRDVSRLFSVDPVYDWLNGNPTRRWSPESLLTSKIDAGEIAYNRIMEMQHTFTESKGIEGTSDISTPKSRALRKYMLAKKYGDQSAMDAATEELKQLGVNRGDIVKRAMNMKPLAGLSAKDHAALMRTLSDKDKAMLQNATDWWRNTYVHSQ